MRTLARLILVAVVSGVFADPVYAVPLQNPPGEPFSDKWFFSVGSTFYVNSDGNTQPVFDAFGGGPWWKPAPKLPAFRLSAAVSYNTKFESMFYDLFGGVRLTRQTSFNLGLAAFDLSAFGFDRGYQVKPFVSYLIAVPVNERFFLGVFIASRPESDWSIDGSMLFRINWWSRSGR